MLELRNISKTLLSRNVLGPLSTTFCDGRIYGLVGENGAGKTVLLKTLAGVYPIDSGTILLDDKPYTPLIPRDAIAAGVAYVPQVPYLPADLTVAQIEAAVGVSLDTELLPLPGRTSLVGALTVMDRQLLELHLALSRPTRMLLLDEPRFFGVPGYDLHWRRVAEFCRLRGIVVILISHNIEPSLRYCDDIVLLHNGCLANCWTTENHREQIRDALEHALGLESAATVHPQSELAVELTLSSGTSEEAIHLVYPGINCFYGALTSDWEQRREHLTALISAHSLFRNRVRQVPGHRADRGLALDATVGENLYLCDLPTHSLRRILTFDKKQTRRKAAHLLNTFSISPPNLDLRAGDLSGGNKQRLALARAMADQPRALVVANPWRGLDRRGMSLMNEAILRHGSSGGLAVILTDDPLESAYWSRGHRHYDVRERSVEPSGDAA